MIQAKWKNDKQAKRAKKPKKAGLLERYPGLGRRIAAMVVVVMMLGTVTWGVQKLRDPQVLPIRTVGIEGKFKHLDRERLQKALTERMQGGFFTVDLNAARLRVVELAWVDKANARRVWPDTVVMHISEQVPLARWGKEQLVNTRGEIFQPQHKASFSDLPSLWGPAGTAADVTAEYLRIERMLAAQGLDMTSFGRSARGAWSLSLSDGALVKLGTDHIDTRLSRLLKTYSGLKSKVNSAIATVDLRYTNGYAVRWLRPVMRDSGIQRRQAVWAKGSAKLSSHMRGAI